MTDDPDQPVDAPTPEPVADDTGVPAPPTPMTNEGRSEFLRAVAEVAPEKLDTMDAVGRYANGIAHFAAMNNELATDKDARALVETLRAVVEARAPALLSAYDPVSTAIVFGAMGAAEQGVHLAYLDLLGSKTVERLRATTAGLRPGTNPKYAVLWPANDDGNVQFDENRATDLLADEIPFIAMRDTEVLYRYSNGVYLEDGEVTVKEWIERRHVERGIKAPTKTVNEIVEAIRRRHYAPRSTFATHGKICLANGVLDLNTRKFSPHSPTIRFLAKFPVVYDERAEHPKFLKLLGDILPETDSQELVQEYFGSILRLGNPRKYAMLFVGEPDTGKSTLLRILGLILGPEAVSAISLQDLTNNRFASAGLFGKYTNIYADLTSEAIQNASAFKALLGNDMISGENKFQRPFSFVNHAKPLFSCNEIPRAQGADAAFFRRWLIVEFSHKVATENQTPGLAEILVEEEGPGILQWMLAGLRRLEANGRFLKAKTVADVGTFWRQQSDPVAWFIDEEMVEEIDATISKRILYGSFVDFAKAKKLPRAVDRKRFDRAFKYITGATEGRARVGGTGDHDIRDPVFYGWRLRHEGDCAKEGRRAQPASGLRPGFADANKEGITDL